MSYVLALFIATAGTMIIMAWAVMEAGMRGLTPTPHAPRSVRERLGYEECSERDWNASYAAITGHVGRWYSRGKAGTRRAIAAVATSVSSADILWLQRNYEWRPKHYHDTGQM